MKMKNIEKGMFRRTEMHKRGGNRDKNHMFFRMSLAVICFMLLFAGTGVASATEYYVATWGNDSNSGTSLDAPWQHPSYATQQAQAGDTIYLINGTWFGDASTITNSGNATHPITITAYNGTPTLNGCGTTESPGTTKAFSIKGKSYINISGLKIVNYTYPVHIEESNHIHYSDCESTGEFYLGGGFTLGSQYIYIDNCTMHETTWQLIRLEGKTSLAREPLSYIYITNNRLYTDYKHNILDINGYMHHIDIIGNELYDSCYDAMYTHTPEYGLAIFVNISNNIIHDVNRGMYLGLKDSYIANNTFYDTGVCFYITNSDNVTFIENTQLPTSEGASIKVANGGTDYLIRNNISTYRVFYGKLIVRDAVARGADNRFQIRILNGEEVVEFTDGKVFTIDPWRIRSENYTITNPAWYPTGSKASIITSDPTWGNDIIAHIYTYSMTTVPASGNATVTVNKFDTSLPQGKILVDFTADTTDGNNVIFTVGSLKTGYFYLIERDGFDFSTKQADSSGYIQFSNSEWSERRFTIEESSMLSNRPPYKPNNPSPSDGATDISINTDLSWSGGDLDVGDTVTYDAYFGTNTSSPLVSENQPETTYDPGTLSYGTKYYWRIVAKDEHGVTKESEVWSFTTVSYEDEPSVTNPTAKPSTILNDNGEARIPGTNLSQLNVTVTDNTGVDTVAINLLPIGGSASAQMTDIPGTDIWTVTVTATAGINRTHNLIVTATDIYGNSNTSESIQLTVLRRGDVVRDNVIDIRDALYILQWTTGDAPDPDVLVGDVDPAIGDGTVDIGDALYIAQWTTEAVP